MTEDLKSMEMQAARAHIYLFFSGVFREAPAHDFIENLLQPSGIDALEALFAGHPALAEMRKLAVRYQAGTCSLEEFQMDFENLLRIPGAHYVHPFESVYRQCESQDRSPAKAMLLGEHARQVARLYQQEGLSPADATTLLPDDLSVELEFMGRLCRRAASALESGREEEAFEICRKQARFLTDHLLQWAQACLNQVVSRAETGLYRALAQLLGAFLEKERGLIQGLPLEGSREAVG